MMYQTGDGNNLLYSFVSSDRTLLNEEEDMGHRFGYAEFHWVGWVVNQWRTA